MTERSGGASEGRRERHEDRLTETSPANTIVAVPDPTEQEIGSFPPLAPVARRSVRGALRTGSNPPPDPVSLSWALPS